jgi:hypothetical protein
LDRRTRPRTFVPTRNPRIHELLAVAVEPGQRGKGAKRRWRVNIAVLLFQISTNLQWLLL